MYLLPRSPTLTTLSSLALACVLTACSQEETPTQKSEVATVVGRGGAMWDGRVQFINALPNPKDKTTCLYLSEYSKKTAPQYDPSLPLNKEQLAFLEKVKRDATPLTTFPVSSQALDEGLAKKENQRRVRGGINNALGALTSFFGFGSLVLMFAVMTGPIAPGAFVGGMTALQALETMFGANIFGAFAYPFLIGGAGGVGLLTQASRDFSAKNQNVRANEAATGLTATNLNVTLAFADVAKTLPAASQIACPKNLSDESVSPFTDSIKRHMGEYNFGDFASMASEANDRIKNSAGCSFFAEINGERLSYSATPRATTDGRKSLDVSIYVIERNGALRLFGETILDEQLKTDAGAGVKYVSNSNLGSMAIWLNNAQSEQIVSAKIAHRLPSGEYLGNVGHIEGTCKL